MACYAAMRRTTFETARFFVWAVLALFLVLPGVTGCGGASNSSGENQSSTTVVPPDTEEGAPLDPSDDKGNGWRWKGKRDHCYYVFENRCFEDKKAACEAAGCPVASCQADSGAPAKIRCAK
jgi:hypothetical protein